MDEIKNEEVVEAVPCCKCEKKTHPVGALVLGVLSVCFGVSFFSFQLAGIILGIIGIVFGSSAKKGTDNPELGKTGMILSIIGLVLNVFNVVVLGALAVAVCYACEVVPQVGYYMDTFHFMF